MDRRIITILCLLILISGVLTACSGTQDVEAAQVFDDVPDDVTWGHAIQVMGYQGYVCGKADRHFDPEAMVNRAEIAVLIVRARHGPDFQPENTSSPWCKCWIDKAVGEGLMSPVEDPMAPATRADVTTLMWLMMQ